MDTQTQTSTIKHHEGNASRYFLGIIIIFFGVVYLLKDLGYSVDIPWRWSFVWPLALIVGGLSLLAKGKLDSAVFGLVVGLGVITLLLHLLTTGAIWAQIGF